MQPRAGDSLLYINDVVIVNELKEIIFNLSELRKLWNQRIFKRSRSEMKDIQASEQCFVGETLVSNHITSWIA